MKINAKKIIKIILISLLSIVILLIFSTGILKGTNYLKHRIKSSDGIDKGMYVTLGGMEQYIHIRTENTSNPVIIYLHGGPGSSDCFVTYLFADKIDEDYTFVTWDQRGAGRTYEHNKKSDSLNKTVNFDRALSDLDELVDLMCQKFNQDKVIIMGHSYGSFLGINYVYKNPEKVARYIGIGQVVCFSDGELRSYEDALKQAEAAGDDTSEMTKAFDEYKKDVNNILKMLELRFYTEKYHQPEKKANDTWNGISSPYMGLSDLRYFLRIINPDFTIEKQKSLFDSMTQDLKQFLDYKIPVDFIQGEYDWTCAKICAEEYLEMINAPSKSFHVIEGCGHCPQYEDTENFVSELKEILK